MTAPIGTPTESPSETPPRPKIPRSLRIWRVVQDLALGGVFMFALFCVQEVKRLPKLGEWQAYLLLVIPSPVALIAFIAIAKLRRAMKMMPLQYRLIDLVVTTASVSVLLPAFQALGVSLGTAWLLAAATGLLFLASMIEARQEDIPNRVRLYLHGLCGLLLKAGIFAVGGLLVLVVPFVVGMDGGLDNHWRFLGEMFGGHAGNADFWEWYFRVGFICLALGLIGRLLLHWLPARGIDKKSERSYPKSDV